MRKKDFRIYRNIELSLYLQKNLCPIIRTSQDLDEFLEHIETHYLYRHEQMIEVLKNICPPVLKVIEEITA